MVSGGSAGIWVVNSSSYSIPSLLFDQVGYDAQAAWSPDGMRIAVVSDWSAYDMVYDVYIVNADGTGFKPVTSKMFDQQDYFYPSWSPDASKLAVNVVERDEYGDYKASVGVMDDDGDNLVVIPSGAVPMTKTSWSADGTRIAYTSSIQESKNDVSWISTDGSQYGIIVTNGWHADWQH